MEGNFTDDGDIGKESVNSFSLIPISSYLKFYTVVRYPVVNPIYNIIEDRLKIESIYDPGYEWYSADYCITYNEKKFIIPQEF